MTHKKPLTLALVIPVYNEEIYLTSCLESIVAQSVKPIQIIVVDNNSTDNTLDIARKYKSVTLLQEKKQGVTFARNTGFKEVKADIIGRIDGDTILPSDWVESVITLFTNQAEVAGFSGPTGFHDLPFGRITLLITNLIRWPMFWSVPKGKRYMFGSNMAVRRQAWEYVANELCTTKGIHEDTDLSLHMEKAGFGIIYSSIVSAMISGRRADASPRQAYTYAFMQKKTFKNHSIRFLGLGTAIVILAFYLPLHFLRRSFNTDTRRITWNYFKKTKLKPRPLPME